MDKNKIHYVEKSKKVQLMGILNCTPDSFYEKGRWKDIDEAISAGIQMANEGADLLDIGGESTRPFSLPISLEEELRRVIPVIQTLSTSIKIPLSIDTTKPQIAQSALEAGATMINDVTGFEDPTMQSIAAAAHVPICIVHMQGNPQTMQKEPSYPRGIITELLEWFQNRIEALLKRGVQESNLIIDPGIGFGKKVEHNIEILKHLPELCQLGLPVLIGLSRKSFMTKILQKPATELLSTTLALNTMSILEGASIIRVHDIKEHRDVIDTLAFFYQ